MNESFPYIACPDCESQLLNPTIEDGMYHFVCHECGSGVWLDIEEDEEDEEDEEKVDEAKRELHNIILDNLYSYDLTPKGEAEVFRYIIELGAKELMRYCKEE